MKYKVGGYKGKMAWIWQKLSLNVIPDFLQNTERNLKSHWFFRNVIFYDGLLWDGLKDTECLLQNSGAFHPHKHPEI